MTDGLGRPAPLQTTSLSFLFYLQRERASSHVASVRMTQGLANLTFSLCCVSLWVMRGLAERLTLSPPPPPMTSLARLLALAVHQKFEKLQQKGSVNNSVSGSVIGDPGGESVFYF